MTTKKIWRTRATISTPKDLGEKALYFDGEIFEIKPRHIKSRVIWQLNPDATDERRKDDVIAYETNRIKEARDD